MRVFVILLVMCLGPVAAQVQAQKTKTEGAAVKPGKNSSLPTSDRSGTKLAGISEPVEGQSYNGSRYILPLKARTVGVQFLKHDVPAGTFVWIPKGEFQMGSTVGTDPDREDDETQHRVVISSGFWILDHELTQAEYERVMGVNPTPNAIVGAERPVVWVSWYEATQFCATLTALERSAGRIGADHEYRLPTEAEWEYAARAGVPFARYTVPGKNVVDSLDFIAWWGQVPGGPFDVRRLFPNDWKLYDMLGNVWEWCSDRYAPAYDTSQVVDPVGSPNGLGRVARGGSWKSRKHKEARFAYRVGPVPETQREDFGFRPVLSRVKAR